jgi:hypothetical protein
MKIITAKKGELYEIVEMDIRALLNNKMGDKPDKSELKDKNGLLDKLGMYGAGIKAGLKKAYDELNDHAVWD